MLPCRWPLQHVPLSRPEEDLVPAAPLPAGQANLGLEQVGEVEQGVSNDGGLGALPGVRRLHRPNLGVPPPRFRE